MSAYLQFHHGSFWFQLKVPKALNARYGNVVRQNLQTGDRAVAQFQAYQMAGLWLSRFQAEKSPQFSAPSNPDEIRPAETHYHEAPVVTGITHGARHKTTASATPTSTSLQETGPSYAELTTAWTRLNPERDPTCFKEMKSVLKEFREIIKPLPQELGRADIARFRDHLIDRRLARATVSKKIGYISTLLQVGFDSGLLPGNVARGIRIPKARVETLVRRSFTTDELKKVFSSPVYTRQWRPTGAGGAAAAWMPLIALATGCRLEEIAQLRVADIFQDKDFGPFFRITDEGEGQSLKTATSRRIIPLHTELIRAGFLDYVEQVSDAGHAWLFPQLEPDHDGRRGENFGRWFRRYLRSTRGLNLPDPTIVFHSFRHTFKTLCRASNLPEEIHDALTGHAPASVGRFYGEVPLVSLAKAMLDLRFPLEFPVIPE